MSKLKLPEEILGYIAVNLGTTIEETPTLEALSARLNANSKGKLNLAYEVEGEVSIYGTTTKGEKVDVDLLFEELSEKEMWDDVVEDLVEEIAFLDEFQITFEDLETPIEGETLTEEEIAELRKEDKEFAELDKALVSAIKEVDRWLTATEKALLEPDSEYTETEAEQS